MHYTADFTMRHYAGFSQIGSHIFMQDIYSYQISNSNASVIGQILE